jgi:hypothetical protein
MCIELLHFEKKNMKTVLNPNYETLGCNHRAFELRLKALSRKADHLNCSPNAFASMQPPSSSVGSDSALNNQLTAIIRLRFLLGGRS